MGSSFIHLIYTMEYYAAIKKNSFESILMHRVLIVAHARS